MSHTSILPKVIAIVGPTASGKTALGVKFAVHFESEIISCDSKQVYRGMDIGTAKEQNLPVAQHLIDIMEPGEKITVAMYQNLAYKVIDDFLERNILPILVGGTMLYASAVIEGYRFTQPSLKRFDTLIIGPKVERDILREKVEKRTAYWLESGLLGEIENLLEKGVSPAWLQSCGMEYRYFTNYLLGELSLEEAQNRTNIAINQYIKRQYTWWKRYDNLNWVESFEEGLSIAKKWLNN